MDPHGALGTLSHDDFLALHGLENVVSAVLNSIAEGRARLSPQVILGCCGGMAQGDAKRRCHVVMPVGMPRDEEFCWVPPPFELKLRS
jgi:hypothetical protein